MRMGMGKNKINMGNARIKMRKKHMIGFVRHEIVYRRSERQVKGLVVATTLRCVAAVVLLRGIDQDD
jgi:hypothetical protein